MNALVSEIKARRAAKLSKADSADERPVGNKGGIRVGPLGQEMRRELGQDDPRRGDGVPDLVPAPEQAEDTKKGGGWFGGRI